MATATGIHHRSYRAELALRHTRAEYARLGLMIVALMALEFVVAFLQAFVFAALTCVYLNEVVNLDHGH